MKNMKYALSIIMLAVFVQSCSTNEPVENSTQGQPAKKAITVRTVKVERESISLSVQSSGVVASETEAKPAFKTGGIISAMLVEEGDAVKKGQLLATLDLTEINAQVQQATEAVNKSVRDLERIQNLYADSVATLENLQDATTGMRVAEENLRMAKFNQSYSEIRSPIAGKVIKKLVNRGEVVGPGMPAYYILGNAQKDWIIRTGLADRDWARVHTGDRATISFDAYPGKSYEAKVTQLADAGNPGSGTFDVELVVVGPAPRLAAGLVASVEIFPEIMDSQTVIPLDALVETNRFDAKVFTVENNRAKAVQIRIAFLHQDKVVVSSGLENVEVVVTDGAPYLLDGVGVEVVR